MMHYFPLIFFKPQQAQVQAKREEEKRGKKKRCIGTRFESFFSSPPQKKILFLTCGYFQKTSLVDSGGRTRPEQPNRCAAPHGGTDDRCFIQVDALQQQYHLLFSTYIQKTHILDLSWVEKYLLSYENGIPGDEMCDLGRALKHKINHPELHFKKSFIQW